MRQHPRREPAGRPGAGDAGAALRAAGASPPAAGDPRAPAGARRRPRATRRARRAAARRSRRCWKGRSAIRATRSGAGARCWRRRRPTRTRWRRWSASWRPATDGGLRLAAAQALEPIYERAGRYAELAAVVRVYVEAQTDARARLEQLMRLAALEETRARRQGGGARDDGARDPRRAVGARAAGAARHVRAADRPRRGSPRSRRCTARSAPTSSTRPSSCAWIARSPRSRCAEGDAATAADYHRRVLDRVPEDEDALEALEGIYREAGDSRGARTRSWSGAPSWRAPTRTAERELRAADRRAGRDRRWSGWTRRSPPTSACWRSRASDREARAGARSPLHARPSAGAI